MALAKESPHQTVQVPQATYRHCVSWPNVEKCQVFHCLRKQILTLDFKHRYDHLQNLQPASLPPTALSWRTWLKSAASLKTRSICRLGQE